MAKRTSIATFAKCGTAIGENTPMGDDIEQSARDLIDRRGAGAVDWLKERIRQLEAAKDLPALDVTYRLLSAVERMLGSGPAGR